MPYTTSALSHNSTYSLQFTAASGNAAVTVMTIKTTGAVTCEVLVNPNVSGRTIANGVARIVFIASAPSAVQAVFTIIQAGITIADYAINSTTPADLIVQCAVT